MQKPLRIWHEESDFVDKLDSVAIDNRETGMVSDTG